MLFLLPGRHAGGDGDVATIAKEHAPEGLRWKLSPLLGTHPALASLLQLRHTPPLELRPAKKIVVGAMLLLGLLPVAINLLAPPSLGLLERVLLWLGGVAVVMAGLYLVFRAKVSKQS